MEQLNEQGNLNEGIVKLESMLGTIDIMEMAASHVGSQIESRHEEAIAEHLRSLKATVERIHKESVAKLAPEPLVLEVEETGERIALPLKPEVVGILRRLIAVAEARGRTANDVIMELLVEVEAKLEQDRAATA